jgi:hypothetical protein
MNYIDRTLVWACHNCGVVTALKNYDSDVYNGLVYCYCGSVMFKSESWAVPIRRRIQKLANDLGQPVSVFVCDNRWEAVIGNNEDDFTHIHLKGWNYKYPIESDFNFKTFYASPISPI